MADNRIDITIEAQNRARGAFQQAHQDLQRTSQHLANIERHSARTARSTTAGFRAMLPAIQQVNDTLATMERRARSSGRGQRLLQRDLQATASVVQQFSRGLNAQTRSVIQEAAQIERLRLGLRTLSPSIQESEAQYRRLIEVARLPGIDFSNALRANNQLLAIGKSGEEATRILMAFGNALALSGASNADIQRTIYGLRQLIADGVVLQRELNLITARVPTAIPILEDLFGGVRAENIREYFDAIGVEGSQQATEFIQLLLPELEKLPRASETAYNALENLGDTSRRVQGAIGENLLPAVKEATAGIEGFLFSVEGDDSLKAGIADTLAFAAAMGTVTAGIVGVGAVLPLLGGLANPIGIAALAAGALAGAFAQAEVQAARLREEYNRTQTALRNALLVGRTEDVAGIQRRIEALAARRTHLQNQIARLREDAEAEQSPTAALATTHLTDESLRVSVEDQTDALLKRNEAYQTYQSQLFQVNKAIEVLTDRTDTLTASQKENADAVLDRVTRAYQNLIDTATGTDAQIAEALQRFENITASEEDSQVVDLARDIGSELVGIAEATRASQIAANKKRVDALARDNSLIIADNERLQALLTSTGKATAARLGSLLDRPRSADELREIITLSQELARTVPAAQAVYVRAVEAFNRQQRGEVRAGQARDTIARRQELQGIIATIGEAETVQEIRQIQAQVQAFKDGLNEKRLSLATYAQQFEAINRAINNQASIINETLRGEARGRQGKTEAQRQLEIRQQVGQAIQSIRAAENQAAVDASVQQIQLTEATEAQILRVKQAAAQRIAELDDAALSRLASSAEARIAQFEDEARAQRQVLERGQRGFEDNHDARRLFAQNTSRAIATGERQLQQLQSQAADAFTASRLERLQHETAQAIAEYQKRYAALTTAQRRALVDDTALARQEYANQVGALAVQIRTLNDLHRDLGVQIEDAFRAERLEAFRQGVQNVTQDIIRLGLDRFNITDTIADALRDDVPTIRFNAEIGDIAPPDLTNEAFRAAFQFDETVFLDTAHALADVTFNADSLAEAAGRLGDTLNQRRFEEDAALRRRRSGEDAEERVRRLQARLRATAARGGGDARAIERNIQQQQDLRFQIAEAQRDARTRLERFDEDTETRRVRLIEDALNRAAQAQAQQTGVIEDIGSTLEQSFKNALASELAGYLTKTAFDAGISTLGGAIGGILSGLGGALGGVLGNILGGGDGDGEGDGDTGTGTGTGQADVSGTITSLALADPPPTAPTVTVSAAINALALADPAPTLTADLSGRITSAELSESAALPSVPGLRGGISNVVLQMNAQLPIVPGLQASITSLALPEGEDAPNPPSVNLIGVISSFALDQEEGETADSVSIAGIINSLSLAEPTPSAPNVNLAGIINALTVEETLAVPAVNASALINSVLLSPTLLKPTIDGLAGQIDSIALNTDIDLPNLPQYAATVASVALASDTDLPTVAGLAGTIANLQLNADIDTPTVTGLDARIDSIALNTDIDLPTITIPATAVVGSVVGGTGGGGNTQTTGVAEEDPENPMLDVGIEGLINPLIIDPEAELPTVTGLTGIITNIVLGPNVTLPTVQLPASVGGGVPRAGGDGGGQAETEDPLNPQGSQYGEVAENISKIAQATTELSTNLNPALGDTPRIDIPNILDQLNRQTDFTQGADISAGQLGFGDALRSVNQFRQGGGGGSTAQGTAVRVTFPPEVFRELAQESTLQAGLVFANQYLAAITDDMHEAAFNLLSIDTFLQNGFFPNIDTRLETINTTLKETINTTLDSILSAVDTTAAAPLVQGLINAGVPFPNDPTDPTNAALTQSPLVGILGESGLSLFAALDNIQRLLPEPNPDAEATVLGGSAANPLYTSPVAGISAEVPLYASLTAGTEETPLHTSIVNLPEVTIVDLDAASRIAEIFENLDGFIGTPNLLGNTQETPLFTRDNALAEKIAAEGALTRKMMESGFKKIEDALLGLPKQEQLVNIVRGKVDRVEAVGGTVDTKVANFPAKQSVTLNGEKIALDEPVTINGSVTYDNFSSFAAAIADEIDQLRNNGNL